MRYLTEVGRPLQSISNVGQFKLQRYGWIL